MVVVLPDPFGPRKPYTAPAGTARSSEFTATWPPRNRLVSARVSIARFSLAVVPAATFPSQRTFSAAASPITRATADCPYFAAAAW